MTLVFWNFLGLLGFAWAGCRYTNPEWSISDLHLTAPSIQVGSTSSEFKLKANWNESLVTAYPQCIDKVNIYANSVLLCSVPSGQETCEFLNLSCSSQNDTFWITLINEDHKDGVQKIRAPSETNIENLCSGTPKVKIFESQSCEAIRPKWVKEPEIEFMKGRRGLRHLKMVWYKNYLENFECLDEFEVKTVKKRLKTDKKCQKVSKKWSKAVKNS